MKKERTLLKCLLGLGALLCLSASAQAQTQFYGFESDTLGATPAGFTSLGDTSSEGVSNTLAYAGTQSLNLNTGGTGYVVNVDAGTQAQGTLDFQLNYNAAMLDEGWSLNIGTGPNYTGATSPLISLANIYGGNAVLYSGDASSYQYGWSTADNANAWVDITVSWDVAANSLSYSLNGGTPYVTTMGTTSDIGSFLFYGSVAADGAESYIDNVTITGPQEVPEPAAWSMCMLGMGLLTFIILRRQELFLS